MSQLDGRSKKRIMIVLIMAGIAAIHIFRIGKHLPQELANLYYSYFSDIVVPLGGYFLLCAAELQNPALKRWETKLAIAFLIPSIAETFQYFGFPVFGSTFDMIDYAMYGLGAALGFILDTQVFMKFNFWRTGGTVE